VVLQLQLWILEKGGLSVVVLLLVVLLLVVVVLRSLVVDDEDIENSSIFCVMMIFQLDFVSEINPGPRCDHTLVLVDNVLILMGGFNDNTVYDDTWYFNLTTSRWLQKKTFTHALFPPKCTDDLDYIKKHNCTHLMWTKPLERDDKSPFDPLPYGQQHYYYPDPTYGPYWGVLEQGASPPAYFPDITKFSMDVRALYYTILCIAYLPS